MITSDEITIEHKGQMPRKMRNNMRIFIASNNENILKVEPTDRRYSIITCSSEKMGDFGYFDRIAEWMEQESNQRGFFNFLMTRDISAVRFQRDRPKTTAYTHAKLDSLPLITKWLISKCKDATRSTDTCD